MSDWQPIETAPDGEVLILYFPKEVGRNSLLEMVKVDSYPVTYPRNPTHWLPLPEYPKVIP